MDRKTLIAILCASCVGAAAAAAEPAFRVAKWRHDAKCAVSLYYDDGTDSAFQYVCDALVRRSIPGTFYLVCGKTPEEVSPKTERWRKVATEHPGIVVLGDHTWLHGGTTNAAQFAADVARNGALVRELSGLPPTALVSFARPGGVKWEITDEEEAAVLAAHGELKRPDFGPCIAGPERWRMNTAAKALAHVDKAEADGRCQPFLFHGVGADWFNFPAAEHERLLAELDRRRAEGRVWPASAVEVQKYAAERDGARLEPAAAGEGAIAAAVLSFSTDPELYDEPLTVVLEDIPGAPDSVVVRIGSGDSATVLRSAVLDGRAVFSVAPVSGSVSIAVSGK